MAGLSRYQSLAEAAQRRLVDIHELAELFQMPVPYLEGAAEQGHIPSLKVDDEFRFSALAVRDALFARAMAMTKTETESQITDCERTTVPP